MRVAKISVMAALLLSTGAYAVENVKVAGDAKLFYGTASDTTANAPDIFEKEASYADAGFSLGVTADFMENVKGGAKFQVMSTLGMQDSIAVNPWSNAHDSESGALETTEWMSEAWIEGKLGNTTGKIGRQILETPLAFTETWSVDYNTFEAAVVTNEDIPDTTLIGAWIGQSNGTNFDPQQPAGGANGSVTSVGGDFNTFGTDGAGVLGVTNNSFKPLTAQAWYYDVVNVANAYWLQADLDMDGFLAGAQYTTIDVDGAANDDSAYALMVGYVIPDTVTLKAAYSSVDDKGSDMVNGSGVYNIATSGQSAGTASSLYTEFWWWFETASVTGADTWTVSAESTVADVDLFLGYWSSEIKPATGGLTEVDEVTFTASKSFGPLDTSVALIYDMFGDVVNEELTTVQLYLTYNF